MKRKLFYALAGIAIVILGIAWMLYPAQEARDRASNDPTSLSSDSAPTEDTDREVLQKEDQGIAAPRSTSSVETKEAIGEKSEDLVSISLAVEGETYTTDIQTGSSVMEVMQKIAGETSLEFETRTFSGIGELVRSINGKADADGFYWFLYVNGKSAEIGASQYMLQDEDQIEWRYKKME